MVQVALFQLCLERRIGEYELPPGAAMIACGVSTGTVSHVLARAEAAGLSWPLPNDLDDEALRARLYPAPGPDGDRVQPMARQSG